MTPEELGARFAGLDGQASVSGGGDFARATVRVPATAWPAALRLARDELDCDFFDWLSAVDELADGYTVVTHLWSTAARHGVLLQTGVPAQDPALASVVEIFPGAAWHERETHEMFGIDFPGHPGGLRPLLLPPEFDGYPLRKQFILASRVAKPWPGAKEPGESESGAARRAPMRPPGVPAPGEWGPGSTDVVPGAGIRDRPARGPRAAAPPPEAAPPEAAPPEAAPPEAAPPEAAPPEAVPTGDGPTGNGAGDGEG